MAVKIGWNSMWIHGIIEPAVPLDRITEVLKKNKMMFSSIIKLLIFPAWMKNEHDNRFQKL
jgi:hypothetical protein